MSVRMTAWAAALTLGVAGCPDPPNEQLRSAVPLAERGATLRYPDVAHVFEAHCNNCHHKAKSDNAAAMRVFESSRYPFATERPDTLLAGLRAMFEERSGLNDEERAIALKWLAGGALDMDGQPPAWRK